MRCRTHPRVDNTTFRSDDEEEDLDFEEENHGVFRPKDFRDYNPQAEEYEDWKQGFVAILQGSRITKREVGVYSDYIQCIPKSDLFKLIEVRGVGEFSRENFPCLPNEFSPPGI